MDVQSARPCSRLLAPQVPPAAAKSYSVGFNVQLFHDPPERRAPADFLVLAQQAAALGYEFEFTGRGGSSPDHLSFQQFTYFVRLGVGALSVRLPAAFDTFDAVLGTG